MISFSFRCLERSLTSVSRANQCSPPPVFSSTTSRWSAVPSSISATVVQSAYWLVIVTPDHSYSTTFLWQALSYSLTTPCVGVRSNERSVSLRKTAQISLSQIFEVQIVVDNSRVLSTTLNFQSLTIVFVTLQTTSSRRN